MFKKIDRNKDGQPCCRRGHRELRGGPSVDGGQQSCGIDRERVVNGGVLERGYRVHISPARQRCGPKRPRQRWLLCPNVCCACR